MKKTAAAAGAIALIGGLSACNNRESAEDKMQEFTEAWNNQNFEEMYGYLSSDTRAQINKETFINRHETIYEDTNAEDLTIQTGETDENNEGEEETALPFSVSMTTSAGDVSFEQEAAWVLEETEDGEEWQLDWSPSYIFEELGWEETINVERTKPARGEILAEGGEPLATNMETTRVSLVPGSLGEEREDTISTIADELNIPEEDIDEALDQDWVTDESAVPVKTLSPDEEAAASEVEDLPGVQLSEVGNQRYYPEQEAAAHLTGYIGNISGEELEERGGTYTQSSQIGKAGLEYVYEERLRGEPGMLISTSEDDVVAEQEAVAGEDVQTTIDISLQGRAYEQIQEDTGATVALNPQNGNTLALVSAPSYDPNNYIYGWPEDELNEFNESDNRPRAAKFNSTYAPGSTVKPITASIGLSNEAITPDEEMTIEGLEWQPDSSWGGYSVTRVDDELSEVNLREALITSDNIYFARTALNTGAEDFTAGLESFGFNQEMPYDFPIENSSIASDGLDSEVLLADTGYGQGQMQMSPVHLASAFTAFVNEGDMLAPQLLASSDREVWEENVVPESGISAIEAGLEGVVEDERGSAYEPVNENISISGKTGTAELKQAGEEEGTENGWFVAYDNEDEDLLIASMIQNVEERGGSSYVVEQTKPLFEE
ncbi:penicillin-binding transpeptidase domain-containing protein [Marinococcus halophilus]|uniref:penicillin-binding transpeptidase domain-containing protein n=1 Tax=Marinococcus halophilus TaxID=1371 RepID=UPI0009A5F203|nr:penicillin-binding transpeptidase domain-containing protein [Marinococcus halophilus]